MNSERDKGSNMRQHITLEASPARTPTTKGAHP